MTPADLLTAFRRRAPRGRRGNVPVFVALLAVPVMGLAGLSVDAARGYMVRSRLSAAIDAAALAAGRVIDTADVQGDAKMYFRANLPNGYMGASVPDPTVQVSPDRETVTVKGSAALPTAFMGVFGIDTMQIAVENRARRAQGIGLELALVLDTTGSMATDDRIGKLRGAASSLVEILYGTKASRTNLWVSVVPYTAEVNLGPTRTGWLTADSPGAAQYSPSTWRGCVEARPSPYDEDDAPPAVAKFKAFLYPSSLGKYADGGDNPWPPVSDSGAYTNDNDRTGPNLGCGFPVLPLTNVKQTVLDKIAGLRAVNRGGTMANLGLQAGWFTLSPRWRGLWGDPTPAGMPLDYRLAEMRKAVVLVTDGNNEWFDYGKQPTGDYTAYGRIGDGRLGTTTFSQATTMLNTRMSRLCQTMKDAGITMYTITIGQTNTATRDLYRGCASQPNFYWDSPAPDQLASIFNQIGAQLTLLRLEQ
ncbi:pilus assembly protein TadG-related protein [Azospirillum sp. TSO22-1]|uniref:pilus assembly protein TadG-related protein n=1 Tax=Azospirillum sp. TSO22-1 TaxID=716789 RepID=UPI0011B6B5C1|nr:pilus assembly protein TadG-related protein [Azospirillum sp. TSO22-1]